jgi:hypothetical protein
MQSGIERSLLHAEHVVGHLLDLDRDGIAVERPAPGEDLQHEQRQRALERVRPCHAQISYLDIWVNV